MNENMLLRRALGDRLWCMYDASFRAMLAELPTRMTMSAPALQAAQEMVALKSQRAVGDTGTVAVIPIQGVIEQSPSVFSYYFGGASTGALTAALREAVADPGITAIVFDVDSPGGSVGGVMELAEEIASARKQKPITAVVSGMMASAAYWLGSQASEVIASPSSLTGSVGVYTLHEDISQYLDNAGVKMTFVSFGDNKTEGNPYEPLGDDAKAHLHDLVNTHGHAFEKAVARGRRTTVDEVHKKYGQGRVFTADKALKSGMVDRIGTIDDALAKHGAKRHLSSRAFSFAEILASSGAEKTKRVDDEDLPITSFAYRGDPEKTADWHLPIEFSTEEKTVKHIRNAIARWSKTEMPDADEKNKARERIKKAAKDHNIDMSDGDLQGAADVVIVAVSDVDTERRQRDLDLLSI